MSDPAAPPQAPRVSVIIPTYGRPAALRRAVDSVLAQTVDDLEVVVVDDHGTPPAPPHEDRRVRVLRLPDNGGVSAARNLGIEQARGEWIAFLDDDDLWYPRRLEALLGFIGAAEVGPRAIVTTDLDINDDGTISGSYTEERPFHHEDQLLHSIQRPFLTVMFMVRRDFLSEVGTFDEGLRGAEDADLLARLLLAGSRVYLVDEVLGCYNRGEGRTRDHEITWSGKLLWLHKLSTHPQLTEREAEAVAAAIEETRHRLLRVRATLALSEDQPRRAFLAAAATVPDTAWRRRGWLLARATLPDRWFRVLEERVPINA